MYDAFALALEMKWKACMCNFSLHNVPNKAANNVPPKMIRPIDEAPSILFAYGEFFK